MEIIGIGPDNLEREHICCAMSEKKGENSIACKKAWLKERFADGLTFLRLDARGKVFIEYIPAEKSWQPVIAPGYLLIDCFWVSGQFKGKGHATRLLQAAVDDARAQGKQGLCALSTDKKRAFLSDPGFFKHKGFLWADSAPPYYELLYLPLAAGAKAPAFGPSVKTPPELQPGFTLFYSHQCPFTEKYSNVIKEMAEAKGAPFRLIRFTGKEQVQAAPNPFTTYALFHDNDFLTNEIMSEKKFADLLTKYGY